MIQSSGPESASLVREIAANISAIVGSTYGKKGGFAIITDGRESFSTKDGVTVVTELWSDNMIEQGVIDTIREASMNTLSKAGDGTTSTIVLANEILKRFDRNDFMSKNEIISGVISNIRKMAKIVPIDSEEMLAVAMTSTAGDKKLSEAILEGFIVAEKEGVSDVIVEPSQKIETTVEVVDGIRFTANPADIAFYRDMSRMETSFDDIHVIVSGSEITGESDIVNMITECITRDIRKLVVIAPSYSQAAVSAMMVNNYKTIDIMPLTVYDDSPARMNMAIKVVATALGAEIIGENNGIRVADVKIEHMGTIEKFHIGGNKVTISGTNSCDKKIQELLDHLKPGLRFADSDQERDMIKSLISILKKKVVKVIVGGSAKGSTKERQDRANDCVNAIELALAGGIVPGAGEAYVAMSNGVKSHTDLHSAGRAVSDMLDMSSEGGGFKPLDPAIVIEVVAEQAIDLAYMLGMTNTIVIKKKKESYE
jgi:chaperonin GroEL